MESWFRNEFGFVEGDERYKARDMFELRQTELGVEMESKANQRRFLVGNFETPKLETLRDRVLKLESQRRGTEAFDGLTFRNIVGNARDLHMDPANEGSVFQVASQFNCLEMVGPHVQPEHGVTGYWRDRTQGPVCAMACPAATVFRNYFCPVENLLDDSKQRVWSGQLGGPGKQLDTTRDVAKLLDNAKLGYWDMQNGYLLPKKGKVMEELSLRLQTETATNAAGDRTSLAEAVTASMRVGVHWNTQTATPSQFDFAGNTKSSNLNSGLQARGGSGGHGVCQVLCSAMPVAYSGLSSASWEALACCNLDAQYEATLAVAAVLALRNSRRVRVFLTLVGGGAFGNETSWILKAMSKALDKFRRFPLSVFCVHYGKISSGGYTGLEEQYKKGGPTRDTCTRGGRQGGESR